MRDVRMVARTTLIFLAFVISGCRTDRAKPVATIRRLAVYQLVISDLIKKESTGNQFVGDKVWVSPNFSKGDSLFYSWGEDIDVDEELVEALKNANQETDAFPTAETFGSQVLLTEIESFHDLYYYGENSPPVDAKCLVQFWRAGFTDDGKRAIVRFYYGPSAHGAAGTYILRYAEGSWRITASTISYYL
jgi:hypothetical protein